MAHLVRLPTFTDSRGSLTTIDKILPFEIKRVYFIYQATALRGGHRHKKTIQALLCPSGSCEIFIDNKEGKERIVLDHPDKCLIVEPSDWHTMDKFSTDCVLMVLASQHYDKEDYIDEKLQ